MATNAGSIKYTIEAETGSLLTAEKVVDKSTDSMSKDFKKVDTAVKNTDRTIDKASKGIAASNMRMTKSSAGVKKGISGIGRSSGQAGIQLQQFVGQIQGGQDAMLALSAQSADLGFVLGAPLLGAVVGIGASLVGMALNAGSAKNSMTELEKIAEALNETLTNSDGSDVLSEKLEKLAKRSSALARLQISTSIADAEKQIKVSAEGISSAVDGAFGSTTEGTVRSFASEVEAAAIKSNKSITDILNLLAKGESAGIAFGKIGKVSEAIRNIGSNFDLTREQAARFALATSNVLNDSSIMNIKKLENTMTDLNDETGGASEQMVKLARTLLPLFNSTVDGVDKVNTLRMAFGDLSRSLKENTETGQEAKTAADDMVTGLTAQFIALGQGEEAAFRFAAAQQLGLKIGEQIPPSIDAQISALFRLKKTLDDNAKADEARKAKDSATKSLTGQVQGIGLTQEESVVEKFKKDLELLRQAEEQKIEVIGTYEERRIELRRQAEERIAGINKKGTEDSILNFEALENQAIGTFAGIATGAMDGKEAIRSLAQSVLTQMIGSLIKLGIQSVIGQTTTAAATSASMVAIATAAAPAAALVSLATSGANAPLAAAGITSTTALAQGAALAGGRQFGGPVTQGNNYRVNEGGRAEVLSSGGKDYLMNSPNGKVKQMDEIGGGGGTTININNMAAGVDVQASTSNDGRTIEIAVRKAVAEMTNQVASGNGAFIRALKSGTNIKTKAGS
jgi:hypothetical protein